MTKLTERHIAQAFEALNAQGIPMPANLQDTTRNEYTGNIPAVVARKLWHAQLQELSLEELRAAVAAWARRPTHGYGAKWPTPGDLLEQARQLRAGRGGAALIPSEEFDRLLSMAQSARSEAHGSVGDQRDQLQEQAWLRLLSQRYGTAPDGEGRLRIQMPGALKKALMEVGALRGLLAITGDFKRETELRRFLNAYDKATEIFPIARDVQLIAPSRPRLLLEDGRVVDDEGLVADHLGRPEHPEVLREDRRLLREHGGPRGGPAKRLGDVLPWRRGGGHV